MSTSVYCPHNKYIELPCIHRIERSESRAWLKAGWNDFRRAWRKSLPIGIVFSMLGVAVLYYVAGRPELTMALSGGFLLVAPILAAGFYQISRQLEWQDGGRIGERPAFSQLLSTNATLFGLLLAVVFAIWINLAMIATAMFSTAGVLAVGSPFSLFSLLSLENLTFVLAYLAIGAVMAVSVFSISVITLPMLIDRKTDLATAMMTSLTVVWENLTAMAIWAAIIAVLMLAGMLSLFIGFAVLFPVLGHASWHAYRATVERG